MNTTDLFCLPYAGGNKYSYREFEGLAPEGLNIIPLEYPGRGARMSEPLFRRMDSLVNDMYIKIRSAITRRPYAIYGHSMGGIVAFLLCKKIISSLSLPAPLHLFVTGAMAPACQFRDAINRHLLSKEAFVEEMRNLDGCPEEILANEELLNYFEPILRADFEAAETYTYRQEQPLDLPITVITGTEESIEEEDIEQWQQETIHAVDFRCMPGKHFFIFKNSRDIINTISGKLLLTEKLISNE